MSAGVPEFFFYLGIIKYHKTSFSEAVYTWYVCISNGRKIASNRKKASNRYKKEE
jgi:hypothetical protein